MPQQKITQALVDGLRYRDKTVWYHDTALKGFNLSVGQQSKALYACGEHKRKFIRVKIGRCDVTKINAARAVAENVLLSELRSGLVLPPFAKMTTYSAHSCLRGSATLSPLGKCSTMQMAGNRGCHASFCQPWDQRAARRGQPKTKPPSTTRFCPVTALAHGEAKKSTASARSAGVVTRPSGV